MKKCLTPWLLLVFGLVLSDAASYWQRRNLLCISCGAQCQKPCYIEKHGACILNLTECPERSKYDQRSSDNIEATPDYYPRSDSTGPDGPC
ncbi:uncharacterized protein LOC119579025 isoform X2 [Penaeus monodon]|uniref:uncharacterized protein LOC119579025 isoform X2 n=2 Tax=Penaeus monodon TaxID=6687 RepID=UPI0018A73A9E|nr:uncharacterized protein LOC119579025 isoform X2 [Penaeus monodon]